MPNAPDPRAVALLGGNHVQRIGFRALAALHAAKDDQPTVAQIARKLDLSRQFVYRGLAAARDAGFVAEVDTVLPRTRKAGAS